MSASIASFAGVAMAGTLAGADPNIGPTYLLPAFAAAFLGATCIKPGRFNPWGTVVASFFLITVETGLELMGYTGWVQQVVSGGALVVAVAAARIVSHHRELGLRGRRTRAHA
jgi:ribose transport system permease protein